MAAKKKIGQKKKSAPSFISFVDVQPKFIFCPIGAENVFPCNIFYAE